MDANKIASLTEKLVKYSQEITADPMECVAALKSAAAVLENTVAAEAMKAAVFEALYKKP